MNAKNIAEIVDMEGIEDAMPLGDSNCLDVPNEKYEGMPLMKLGLDTEKGKYLDPTLSEDGELPEMEIGEIDALTKEGKAEVLWFNGNRRILVLLYEPKKILVHVSSDGRAEECFCSFNIE